MIGHQSDQVASEAIGPEAWWRPPPLVTLTFRDYNGSFWAAGLDANTQVRPEDWDLDAMINAIERMEAAFADLQ